ncbi:DUF885 domain-containing protein [Gandjariella thermophila]|uniref:DUF885 domain-containing protein n=1 Tax=Gandjariella thermophila TaxID=1931992 RepID=A0A4D4IZZ5_9PSEU|nr:DUF885 domain-containing protein [Gandjariella thermophila]GDY28674.1 hypothetical protein GTS_03070 [Gandjariella thermophila]
MTEAPGEVARLADQMTELLFDEDPLSATLYGIRDRDERLPDLSQTGESALRTRAADLARRAEAAEPRDATERVTRDVVGQQARSLLDRIDAHTVEFTVTDLLVAPASALLYFLPLISLPGPEHARAYLRRLAAVPEYLDAAAARHRAGIAAGRLPVRYLAEAAVRHLDGYLGAPEADPLARPQPVDGDDSFTAERDRLLAEVVRPAFARYQEALATEVVPHGRGDDRPGLCWLPDGERAYAGAARSFTTTDRTPEELHRTGREIMARLADEYAEIGARAFGTADVAEVLERLRSDPALRWGGAEEMLETARRAIARAEEAAPRWFGRLPAQRCEVRPVPAGEAPGAPAAYYVPPAMDGSRPGTYFANTHRAEERYRHAAEATAFHEAVPGHHFQLSLAQELTDLPLLRRVAPVTAYLEGWGLYTERLADEMGLYSDDLSRLGMLTLDSMRAGRLVVDTGVHAFGWSRDRAVRYLAENTPMAQVEIVAEVDRYIAWPGQALAYMVGRLEIQRIRAEAERALGERFDIRAFHDVVLGGGPLPLAVLADVVADWTGRVGAPATPTT